jgi:segregation and condensation protein B
MTMSEEIEDHEIAEPAEPFAADDDASTLSGREASSSLEDSSDEGEALLDDDDEEEDDDDGVVIHDADAEDALEEARLSGAQSQTTIDEAAGESLGDDVPHNVRSMAEMMAIIEALVFVAEEPLSVKALSEVLKEDRGWIETAVEELAEEFNARGGGLYLREVAGGWQFATRPEHHEHVRAFLKTRPSAKLSLASLETLAVIAYKQPITVPEILEIRGVQSPSAIKTLLDKRLIVAKGRKETIGRPMMYGTSKEFLLQFGLKDLSELPSIEDFEDLAGGM